MGQKQQNPLERHFQNNMAKCEICQFNYDLTDHKPMYACNNHHTLCNICLKDLKNPPICPFCRLPIDREKVLPNNLIMQLIEARRLQPQQSKIEEIVPPKNADKEKAAVHPLHLELDPGHEHDLRAEDSMANVGLALQAKNDSSQSFKTQIVQCFSRLTKTCNCGWYIVYSLQLLFQFFIMLFCLHIGFTGWQKCNQSLPFNTYARSLLVGFGLAELFLMIIIILFLFLVGCQALTECEVECIQLQCSVLATIGLLRLFYAILAGMYLYEPPQRCFCKEINVFAYLRASEILSMILAVAFAGQFAKKVIFMF